MREGGDDAVRSPREVSHTSYVMTKRGCTCKLIDPRCRRQEQLGGRMTEMFAPQVNKSAKRAHHTDVDITSHTSRVKSHT
jgi:hypothetical protein